MDATREIEVQKKVGASVQRAITSHKVNHEDLGNTMDFLCQVIGGMIGAVFPAEHHEREIQALKDSIEYGIDNGVPQPQ